MRSRDNIPPRRRRTRVVRSRRLVARARSLNVGTCEEYPADQTENQSDLPSLTPEIEISYSPSSHVPEDLTTILFPDDFSPISSPIPSPLRKLSPSPILLTTDFTINSYTPPAIPFSFFSVILTNFLRPFHIYL